MLKFVLIPDSFKGTMSSTKVCEILSKKIKQLFKDSEIISLPVADGGEGTVECFLIATNGKKIKTNSVNPYMEKSENYYGIFSDTAVIETAETAGLPLVENRKNPLLTSTFGLGEQIKDAIDKGYKKIIVGLGGSCTNDYGCGMASALGVKFFDKDNKEFIPTGGTLINVCDIDISKNIVPSDISITAMCDVINPPYGENGASRVFAKQKGANEKGIELLDEGVKHLTNIIKEKLGKDYSNLSGGGAAGALGAGLKAFFNAQLKSGIDTVLDTLHFDEKIENADFIITGEGKLDGQSLSGKVIYGISKRAKKQGKPVIAIVGGAEGDMAGLYQAGVTAVFPINRLPQDFSISRFESESNLSKTAEDVLRLIKQMKK